MSWKNIKKKFSICLLLCVVILSMTGCGETDTKDSQDALNKAVNDYVETQKNIAEYKYWHYKATH